MSTCSEVDSDVHALIKELAISRVEHKSATHSSEPHHLAEGTEVARFRRRFYFFLQYTLSFLTRHHLCRQGVALVSIRQLRSQGPVFVHAHRTEGVTESEVREGASGGGNGDRNRVGGGDGDVNGDGDGDGAGAGTATATGVEANEGAQYGNGDGSGDGNETSRRYGNGDEDGDEDASEDGIGEGGRDVKKREKPHKNCRRYQALLFRTLHHLCRQGVTLAGTR